MRKPTRLLTVEESTDAFRAANEYWPRLKTEVTSSALYVDACAILNCHQHKSRFQETTIQFLQKEASSYRFITSTYVVAEVVRRLVTKTTVYPFRGPNEIIGTPLAVYVMNDWLESFKIMPITVPPCVFEIGKMNVSKNKGRQDLEGWSLTDAISYEIVRGLGQNQIVSHDGGFRVLGLVLLPY
jgi:hypothetical protein